VLLNYFLNLLCVNGRKTYVGNKQKRVGLLASQAGVVAHGGYRHHFYLRLYYLDQRYFADRFHHLAAL